MKHLPLLLLLAACPGSDDDPCKPGADPTFLLGDGRDAFTDVEDGATVDLVHGPQGGTHLELGVAGTFLPGSKRTGVAWLRAVATGTVLGDEVAASNLSLGMRCDPPQGRVESWTNTLVLDVPSDQVHDQDMFVEVDLLDDREAIAASASLTFHVLDPEL
jgi:hypothetical protein